MGKVVPLIILLLALVAYYILKPDGFDPASVRNKRVLITGASAGIGEQLAYEYAKLGARIVLTARRAKVLEEVVLKCKKLGATKVDSVAADMANPDDRSRVVRETQTLLGGLDHLILNHAFYDMHWWTGSAENMTTLRKYLDINFLAYVDLTSKALPMLMVSKGNIGVVSSVLGKIGSVEFVPYATTKFAIQGFFSSYRQELMYKETGISVTLCILGLIDTDTAMNLHAEVHPGSDFSSIAGSANEAAVAILKGVTTEKYEIYYPRFASVIVNLHKVIPGYLEDFSATQNKK